MKEFPYGTVLKIERDRSRRDIYEDLDSIRSIGMNTVVIWPPVYWWEAEREQEYPVETGRAILDHAEKVGLAVIMEVIGQIPTLEYAPSFRMKEAYLAVERDGSPRRRLRPYDYINFNHPEVQELIDRYLRAIALAYRGYPALAGYDIWNETMFTSYDGYTRVLFARWLEERYGTLEALNEAWDQSFRDWSEIDFSEWIWASVMPVVDFNQFRKWNVAEHLKRWRSTVRELDTDHPCIADNIHSMVTADEHYDRPQDDWAVAASVDRFGISFYPKNRIPGMEAAERWEVFSAVRAASPDGGFWVSEMQSHNQSMFNPFNAVRPHELRWWNWEAICNGADAVVYWKWRPFTRGVQTAGRGLVDLAGRLSERAGVASSIASLLGRRPDLFTDARPLGARAGILYDGLNHDFIKAYIRSYEPFLSGSIYTDSIAGLFRCFWEQNVAVDIISPERVRGAHSRGLRVLFVTNQVVVDERLASALLSFAESGGTVVFDGKLGVVDSRGRLHERLPGGGLAEKLGFFVTDTRPDGLEIEVLASEWGVEELGGYHERFDLSGGEGSREVLGRFGDARPALVRVVHGAGELLLFATHLWYGFRDGQDPRTSRLAGSFARRFGLALERVGDPRLKTRMLLGSRSRVLFVFNYGGEAVSSTIEVDESSSPVLGLVRLDEGEGEAHLIGGTIAVTLPARSVALLELASALSARTPRSPE